MSFFPKRTSAQTNAPGQDSTRKDVATDVRLAAAQQRADDKAVDGYRSPGVINDDPTDPSVGDTENRITGDRKMERLVADDFPFDESQLAAVEGMVESQYACMTGSAGTGKTTSTKRLVDRLIDTIDIGAVDMSAYWSSDFDERLDNYDDGDSHDYSKSSVIPSIAILAFTGRASQQVKRNFPESWWGNIMTIHRALGFVPEPYTEWDPEWIDPETGMAGGMRTKRRFVPTYTADLQMPWDVIIIDEAGMLGVDLWHQLWAATKHGCRVYMIGDINQLPPVQGKSIFGFAMAKWPAFELTKVHRQQGVNNPIVDNAWRVIHGRMPQTEGRFQMIPIPGDAALASRKVRAICAKLKEMTIYDPIRDTIISPINGEDGARGYALGQLYLNREFAMMFNSDSEHPRYIIDGGRDRKQFAVGDKVMATRNDWETGITNGMTGIITSIAANGAYAGDSRRFGIVSEVNAYLASEDDDVEGLDPLSLDDLEASMEQISAGLKAKREKKERGPASHIVTVRFGSEEHGFEYPFATLAEVGSLMTAYAATCHKMQGGEAPTIIIIVHDSHKSMLYREWLYTAITRASEKCIVLCTESAMKIALNKQTIKGKTLQEKVASFNALMKPSVDDISRIKLPESQSIHKTILEQESRQLVTEARLTTEAEKSGGLAKFVAKAKSKQAEGEVTQEIHVHVSKIEIKNIFNTKPAPEPVVDGGTIQAEEPTITRPALEAPASFVSQWGAYNTAVELGHVQLMSQRLLPAPKPVKTLASLFNRKKES